MIWLISVLSLMPKGEIVGIKSVLPLVTTLSNIIPLPSSVQNAVSTESHRLYRAPFRMQYLPSHTDSTKLRSECSIYRVTQTLPSSVQDAVSTESHRLYRAPFRMQCLPGYTVFTEYSSECSVHRVQFRMQCSPSHHSECSDYRATVQSSVNRVNFLYRVSSGYQVQNYSR